NFNNGHTVSIAGLQNGLLSLITPEIRERFIQCPRVDRVEFTGLTHRLSWSSCIREVKAVVVHRAESADQHGTTFVIFCLFFATQKCGQIPALTFRIEHLRPIQIGYQQMSSVCWEYH